MTLRVSIVVGNPKPASRTLRIAKMLVERLLQHGPHAVEVIDLADYQKEIFSWPSDVLDEIQERVSTSQLVVFASPTYKATFTGLLKAFLDRFPPDGLAGVTAIPLLTGADDQHSMGPTVNLAPLLVELGAVVPGQGFYFSTANMDRVEEIVTSAAAKYSRNLQAITNVSARTTNASAPTDSDSALAGETRQFRDALGHFASGITVVSSVDEDGPVGFTCQSFYSVSVEPPLISFSVMTSSTSYPRVRDKGRFVVNVLSHNQGDVSSQFARSGTDKWQGVEWYESDGGLPVIYGSLMWLECEIWAEYLAGDHYIVVGRVTDMGTDTGTAQHPLLFFKGQYRHLQEIDLVEMA